MSQCTDTSLARSQAVWVVLETTPGELEKPTGEHFIKPNGRAEMSQTPSFTESEELSNYLDPQEQDPDAMPPGDWTINTVLRITPNAGKPQANDLIVAAFGSVDTSMVGQRKYLLQTCRPKVSIWVLNDHTMQIMRESTVTGVDIPVTNTGAFGMNFTGQGKRMEVIGNGTLDEAPTDDTIKLESGHSKRFSGGGYLMNKDSSDIEGYKILSVNYATDTITLDSAPLDWTAGETVGPWIPPTATIGERMLNANVDVVVDGESGEFMESTLSLQLPSEYLSPVGADYPTRNADGQRSGTMGLNAVFVPELADRLLSTRALITHDVKISVTNEVGVAELHIPRLQRLGSVPAAEGEFLMLNTEGALLGGSGNDFVFFTIKGA